MYTSDGRFMQKKIPSTTGREFISMIGMDAKMKR